MESNGDEFEQYRSRAYSAGSRFGHTRSLPGTPRVRKYLGFHSLCGIRGDAEEPGVPVRPPVEDDAQAMVMSPIRSAGDGQEAETVVTNQGTHHHIGIPVRNELEPLRRAISMKHHRNRSRFHSCSPVPPSTPPPSPGFPGISPPGRTDSPTPNSWRGRSPNRPKDLDLGRAIRPRTSSMPARSQLKRPDPARIRAAHTSQREDPFPETFGVDDTGPTSLQRVRSFKTTSKGIINRGDSFKMRGSSSHASLDSIGNARELLPGVRPRTSSNASSKDSSGYSRTPSLEQDTPMYQVLMVGGQGVGKTSLTQQFMTSEYMGHMDTATGESSFILQRASANS